MTKKADKNDKDKKTTLPADGGTITTRVEQKQVEQRIAIGANIVYETIRREGEEELHRTAAALAWPALAAGLSMGFSFIAEALLTAYLPDAPWRPLISRLGYCVGFLIIILGRQQLFTENTLTVILPLLLRKDMATLLRVVRLWSVVLCANFVGTYFFAPAYRQRCVIRRPCSSSLYHHRHVSPRRRFRNHVHARHLRRMAHRADGLVAPWS